METVRNKRLWWAAASACMVLGLTQATASRAALGDESASVERDRAAMKGTLKVTPQLTYEVHEITAPTGHVREYVASGHVFAVAWDGHANPDLNQLLGTHVDNFHALVKPQPGNHHVVSVQSDGMIISLRKLPRGMEGHVVIPALVPSGVSLAALR